VKDEDKKEPHTLYEFALPYLKGELSTPEPPETREVQEIIVNLVPEIQENIREQEEFWEEKGITVSIYSSIGYLGETLGVALEERDKNLVHRCLQAVEELIGIPSNFVQETVGELIVEPLADLLVEVNELYGPRLLALIEGTKFST